MTPIDKYHTVLKEHAAKQGLIMNPDWDTVKPLLEGLLRRGEQDGIRTCPCRISSGDLEKDRDIVCPCDYRDADVAEFGGCYCSLYVDEAVAKGEKTVGSIPERRPPKEERGRVKDQVEAKAPGEAGIGVSTNVWRCPVCGYLCAKDQPPMKCPICGAKKDRFELFMGPG